MSTSVVALTQDRGSSLIDINSKSQLSKAAAYCVDLDGCGTPTHVKYSFDISIQARTACAPPSPALVASLSGILKLDDTAGGFGDGRTGADSYDAVFALITAAAATAANAQLSTADALIALTPFIDERFTAVILENRAKSFVIDTISPRTVVGARGLLNVSRPARFAVLDQCGEFSGVKLTSSLSYSELNEITCKPFLSEQLSLSLFLGATTYELTDVVAGLTKMAQVSADLSNSKMEVVTDGVTSAFNCSTGPDTVFGLVALPIGEYTVGVGVN